MSMISSPKYSREFDFIAGLMICVVAVIIFMTSLKYIAKTLESSAPYYQSAGFFPAIISSMLFVCACCLMRFAFKNKLNFKRLLTNGNLSLFRKRILNFLLVIGWLGFYVFVLLGYFSYSNATFIFLFVFMSLFHVKERCHMTVKQCASLLLGAFLMSQILSFLFQDVAKIPLP
jgi:hypothetical protein